MARPGQTGCMGSSYLQLSCCASGRSLQMHISRIAIHAGVVMQARNLCPRCTESRTALAAGPAGGSGRTRCFASHRIVVTTVLEANCVQVVGHSSSFNLVRKFEQIGPITDDWRSDFLKRKSNAATFRVTWYYPDRVCIQPDSSFCCD